MLNAKSSENFLSPDQNWANFGGFERRIPFVRKHYTKIFLRIFIHRSLMVAKTKQNTEENSEN